MIKIELANERELLDFAARMGKTINKGAIIFLSGPLGSGKTTFVRGFLHSLGYNGKVKSPTYTLVEPYHIANRDIYHFDLFRLKAPEELEFIGIKEYFSKSAVCLVEWPEKGFPLLPVPDLTCYIGFMGQGRSVRLEAHSAVGEGILRRVV